MTHSLTGRLLRPLACAALLAGTALPALAQSTTSSVTLDAMTVSEKAEPSLTNPSPEAARAAIEKTPGAVEVVPDVAWRDTASTTLKDMFAYVPGVFVQPKWGEDSRFSIRGSGLSRNFHLRGIQLYQDGIPLSAADGGADFQEIDPTAYRYVEVYKGANGLRYGANSLGGAVNFVTQSGRDSSLFEGRTDVGSFGFRRLQASSGAADDMVDAHLTASFLEKDGFRDFSGGESKRASGNVGLQLGEDVETRFYMNLSDIQQYIPGSLTKEQALTTPEMALASNVARGYQRNMESVRIANKTSILVGETNVEVGAYFANKDLIHPIYQYLDYGYNDYGAFARATDQQTLFGHENNLTVGMNVVGGYVDNKQYVNNGGQKGDLLSASKDRSLNLIGYAENGFNLLPDLTLVTGLQAVHATRERDDEFADSTDTSGKADYDFLNPKIGLLWQVDPGWQVFGNLSRSGEAPTFSELNFTNAALSDTDPQYATTLEIGTRGRRDGFTWDLAVYRAHLENEFQYFDLGGGSYSVTNADKTIHQGVEAGFGWRAVEGVFTGTGEADSLWLNGAYTFSDFRFDGDADWGDNELPGAPRHLLRAELLYKSPLGFYAGPNVEWVPEAYYVDNANSQKTERYALLGFRAGYDLNAHFSFFVDARNLTDEKYISNASVAAVATSASALYEPGDGRAVYAGLRFRW